LDLLILLVERPGHLVSREEIATRLWGNGVHVDAESGINTAIRKLRAALNDSAEQPALIETVPSKGYRFIGPVSVAGRSPVTAKISERPQRPWIRNRTRCRARGRGGGRLLRWIPARQPG
jgi:DNA-binding winged helix-turn-helix (wHTH) protein